MGRVVPRHCSSSGTTTGGGSIFCRRGAETPSHVSVCLNSPRTTPCSCGRRACRLAVCISSRSTRQWCLSCPPTPLVSPSCASSFCLVNHFLPTPSNQVTSLAGTAVSDCCQPLQPSSLQPSSGRAPPQTPCLPSGRSLVLCCNEPVSPLPRRNSHNLGRCSQPSPPDFREAFQVLALRQQVRKREFTVFSNTISKLGTNENPCTRD